jgi:dTDP-4-dehydrorhamnose reductase
MTSSLRVIILGGSGQLGRALLRSVPEFASAVVPTRVELDVSSADEVGSYIASARPDLIVNAAAYTAVDKAESEREQATKINAEGARHVAEAAATLPSCRVIHISTDFVFDGAVSLPYKPDSPTAPLSIYAQTKRAGELEVRKALPTRSLVLRTAWLYSSEGHNFLLAMLRILRERRTARVVADQVGTPTSSASLADVIWRFAARPDVYGVFHWTDAGVASWYDFAVAIAEEGAARGLLPHSVEVVPITTEEYPTPAKRPRFSVLDKCATIDALGVQPVHWRRSLRGVLDALPHGDRSHA